MKTKVEFSLGRLAVANQVVVEDLVYKAEGEYSEEEVRLTFEYIKDMMNSAIATAIQLADKK